MLFPDEADKREKQAKTIINDIKAMEPPTIGDTQIADGLFTRIDQVWITDGNEDTVIDTLNRNEARLKPIYAAYGYREHKNRRIFWTDENHTLLTAIQNYFDTSRPKVAAIIQKLSEAISK